MSSLMYATHMGEEDKNHYLNKGEMGAVARSWPPECGVITPQGSIQCFLAVLAFYKPPLILFHTFQTSNWIFPVFRMRY